MVKYSITLLLMLSLTWLIAVPSFASADTVPSIALSIDKAVLDTGSEVKVTITGSHLVDLYAYEAIFHFDTKRVKLKAAVSLVDGFSVAPITNGDQIKFAHTKVGKKAGDDGTLALAVLTFTAIQPGTAVISLEEMKLVNAKLEAISIKSEAKVTAAIRLTAELSDIAGHWGEANIRKAVQLGIVKGYDNGSFMPNRQVTREEFAVMLVRAMALPATGNTKSSFHDAGLIPSWASEYVMTAADSGWISGYEDMTFRPKQLITRSEITAMCVRALSWELNSKLELSFNDAAQIAKWARPYVALAAEHKLIGGRGNNLFAPDAATTRAEAVTIIIRMLDAKTK